MRCPAATSAALPCRRGAGDAGFHVGTVPPGRYTARRRAKYPRRPRRGTSKQGPAQGPAATSAALPCGRGCRGRGISRRNSSEVKSRITKPTAGAWPDYVAHKKIKRESACMGGGGCGRGRRPRRPDPSAERCGAAHCVGSGGRARRAPLPMSGPFHCAPRRGHCASRRGHCAPEPTNVGDPCGRPAPRVARIHRTPGERSCAGVIETRNRSAWATLRFGANKFNHLSICAREGPLTGFLYLFYIF